MCISCCVRRTLLEEIFCRSSPPRKCIDTKCSSFEHLATNMSIDIRLIFIAAVALVYWKRKCVCRSGCVQRMLSKQFFASSSPPLDVHWYQAWRRSSFKHPSKSISIDIQLIYCSCHSTSILEKQTSV